MHSSKTKTYTSQVFIMAAEARPGFQASDPKMHKLSGDGNDDFTHGKDVFLTVLY